MAATAHGMIPAGQVVTVTIDTTYGGIEVINPSGDPGHRYGGGERRVHRDSRCDRPSGRVLRGSPGFGGVVDDFGKHNQRITIFGIG